MRHTAKIAPIALALILLVGCASPLKEENAIRDATLEPPRDGRIAVFVSGNADRRGAIWVAENTSPESFIPMVEACGQFASSSVTVYRGKRKKQFLRKEVQKLKPEWLTLQHADMINFHYDKCL